jgi:hypothetical protein
MLATTVQAPFLAMALLVGVGLLNRYDDPTVSEQVIYLVL